MKFINNIKKWHKYHKIEVFGAIVGFFVLILIIDVISISIRVKAENNAFMKNNAIYVSNFTTSLSGKTGNIARIYVNPKKTKCVILLYFDDIENLVTDASKYQVYVKGYDIEKGKYAVSTKNKPVGGYYIFGSTGYSAIYLSDANGFQEQCIECIVRCNELLTNAQLANVEAANRDPSYAQYDQWRIIVNPLGESAKTGDFLDDFDIVSLYQDAVIDINEESIRNMLTDNINNLNVYMKQIETYRNNLKVLGVRVPSLPAYISGDVFSYDENKNGEQMMIYTPEYIFEAGVDFDWFRYNLHDKSFIDDIKDPLITDTQFFNKLQNFSNVDRFTTQKNWYMSDGTLINRDEVSASQLSNMKSINDNIKKYETVLNQYYTLKKEYQCTNLVNYLILESNMRNTGKYFTSNYSENAVIVW